MPSCQAANLHPAGLPVFVWTFRNVSEFDNQGGSGPIEAEVKWYNARKGFGFVLGPDGQDVFFHASALTEAGIEPPETGDKLVCEIGTDRQGRRLVTKIFERKLGPGAPAGDRPRRDFGRRRSSAASRFSRVATRRLSASISD